MAISKSNVSVGTAKARKIRSVTARATQAIGQFALLGIIVCGLQPVQADDFVAEEANICRVTVHQVHLQNNSTLDRLRGFVAIELTVENLAESDLDLELSKMSAVCGEAKDLKVVPGRRDSLVEDGSQAIAAGELARGWLMFPVTHSSSKEPALELTLNCHEQPLTIPLNQAVRKTSNCNVRRLGPSNILAVIELKRPVDGLSVWILSEKFEQLKQASVDRVIVEYLGVENTWAISNNSISANSVDSWLQSAIATEQPIRLPFLNAVKSPVQFQKLFVVQPSTYRRPAYGFVSLRKPDLQSAIAASLRDVFQAVSPEELEAAFVSSEAGIRQAAMETNLDRLSAERLQQIFDEAADNVDQQKLLARELYRSASPVALQLLNQLVRSEDKEVSQAAMSSIVRSPSSDVVPLTLGLWREFGDDPVWETDLVNAILKQDDYRMTPILAAYAEKRLTSMVKTSDSDDVQQSSDLQQSEDAGPTVLPQVPFGRTTAPRSQSESKTLPRVLHFLRRQNDSEFEDVARRQVLKISDPGIQDDVLGYLLDGHSGEIRRLARAYLAQRLAEPETKDDRLTDEERSRLEQKYAPRSSSALSKRYSRRMLTTARRFPRPEYTERLLALSDEKMLNSSSRSMAFTAALLGANSQQLDAVLKDFRKLTRIRRSQALTVLFHLRHPRRFEIAQENLNLSDESAEDTIRQLVQNSSLEAALLAATYLDKARKSEERKLLLAGDSGEPSGLVRNLRSVQSRLLTSYTANLSQVIHPEVQTFINRMEKSPVMSFHDMARIAKGGRVLRSRNNSQRRRAEDLRKDGKTDEAEKVLRKILEADPYDDPAMISLASLCMRSDRAEEAMKLLLRARELSPEDVDTESFLALAMIRLGDVEGGLKHAEETLNQVPDLPTSLRTNAIYNTACSYSRAIEQVDDDERKKELAREAFRYLRLSIDRENGFWEVEHALADPDLVALHDDPAWEKAIGEMRKRAENAPQP